MWRWEVVPNGGITRVSVTPGSRGGKRAPFDFVGVEVCMNPRTPCGACIFQSGHLAKWCPESERLARASLDAKQATKSTLYKVASVGTEVA